MSHVLVRVEARRTTTADGRTTLELHVRLSWPMALLVAAGIASWLGLGAAGLVEALAP